MATLSVEYSRNIMSFAHNIYSSYIPGIFLKIPPAVGSTGNCKNSNSSGGNQTKTKTRKNSDSILKKLLWFGWPKKKSPYDLFLLK